SLLQIGAGTDTSHGLIEVTAAGNRDQAESGHIVDSNVGPDNSSGNGVTADLLGATPGGANPTVDADAGHHAGASLVTVNAGNTADQIHIPALDGVSPHLGGIASPLPGVGDPVPGVTQTVAGLDNGGNVNGVLDAAGHDTGSLVDS